MTNYKTINLAGAEVEVEIDDKHCDIRNDGNETIYAGCMPGLTPGAEGVLSVPPGQAAKLLDVCLCGKVYLLGTGSVQLCSNDYGYPVFKSAAPSSGGGGAGGAVQMTTTVLCNSTSSESAISFSESADNYDLIIGTVKQVNSKYITENVAWSPKFGTLSLPIVTAGDNGTSGNYVLNISNTRVWMYQSGYTSRIQSITAKLYGVKFSNS